MQGLYVAGTRKSVHLWKVENVGFRCRWNKKKCPVKRGVHSWEVETSVGF